jgi:hypothetical protein
MSARPPGVAAASNDPSSEYTTFDTPPSSVSAGKMSVSAVTRAFVWLVPAALAACKKNLDNLSRSMTGKGISW